MTAEKSPTWFITGASSGFGMAFARYALERGYNVAATARSPEKLQSLATEQPNRVLLHRLDVTIPSEAQQAVSASLARFGRIDLLINNAGYGVVGALEETPDADLRAQMETNFFGAVSVTRAALPSMRAARSGAERSSTSPVSAANSPSAASAHIQPRSLRSKGCPKPSHRRWRRSESRC